MEAKPGVIAYLKDRGPNSKMPTAVILIRKDMFNWIVEIQNTKVIDERDSPVKLEPSGVRIQVAESQLEFYE
jgi:hypothetical protein